MVLLPMPAPFRLDSGEIEVRVSEHPNGKKRTTKTRATTGIVQVGAEAGHCLLNILVDISGVQLECC